VETRLQQRRLDRRTTGFEENFPVLYNCRVARRGGGVKLPFRWETLPAPACSIHGKARLSRRQAGAGQTLQMQNSVIARQPDHQSGERSRTGMLEQLAPRERQIVEALYGMSEATAQAIRQALPVELSDQAVRAMLTRLESKGLVERSSTSQGLIFKPRISRDAAQNSAVTQLVDVFFAGSRFGAVTALLGDSGALDDAQIQELEEMLRKAREGRDGT
jgi:predicted transcriptional regulator